MNQVKLIRHALKMSQSAFGTILGMTQGNVSQYENGQEVPRAVAERLIAAAAEQGLHITYDHVYGVKPIPSIVGVVGNFVCPVEGIEGASDAACQEDGHAGISPVAVAKEEAGLAGVASAASGGGVNGGGHVEFSGSLCDASTVHQC